MKILYLDFFLGMETEMLIGAFISLGADKDELEAKVKAVFPKGHISCTEVKRCGIEALRADVFFDGSNIFKYEEALEYVDLHIDDNGALMYLKRIFKVYFEADSVALIEEKEICRFYAVYLALKSLDADYVISSSIKEGSGFCEKDGGFYIIPSYTALEIFKNEKITVKTVELEKELTGALGASVLSAVVNEYGTMPEINIEKIGYGAGKEDLSMPNLLRAVLGTADGGEIGKMFESTDLFAEISEEIFV